MVCPKCSKQSQDGAYSCQWCGTALPQAAQPVSAIAPPISAPVAPVNQPMAPPLPPLQPIGVPVTPSMPTASTAPVQPPMQVGEQIPEGIKGWSWAAFLGTWIWAIGNKTYIGLLVFVPVPGVALVMSIILGIYGREWAWKNKEWSSVEEFNRVQRNWVKWMLIIGLSMFGLGLLGSVMLALIQQSG